MFTGITGATGVIQSAEMQGDLRLAIACPWDDLAIGESVAVNGACLTVAETGIRDLALGIREERPAPTPQSLMPNAFFAATLSAETLARTAPRWRPGDKVNLERALKAGDRISGHLVTGHVDGVAVIESIAPAGDSHVLRIASPPALAKYIAEKGSVTLDGVSLTVNQVEGARFFVNIIPHTWHATTLCERRPGDALNLEIDLMARYAERLLRK